MPGRNLTGTHNTDDYSLGRGKAYFAELESDGSPGPYRDLGNVSEFNISVEKEELDHQSSREGLKVIDKTVVISQKVTISSLVMDNLDFQNIAFFFSGTTTSRSNSDAVAGVSGTANLTIPADGDGRWYDLYSDTAGKPATDFQAGRIYDIGALTVQKNGGGSSMTLGTDYNVDLMFGRIFVIVGGLMTAGDYDIDFAAKPTAAATVDVMKALTQSAVEGALKFIGENPAANDHSYEWQFHQTKLSAEGDVPLIGDEWTTLTVSGTAERNEDADPDSPTLTVTTHANAHA